MNVAISGDEGALGLVAHRRHVLCAGAHPHHLVAVGRPPTAAPPRLGHPTSGPSLSLVVARGRRARFPAASSSGGGSAAAVAAAAGLGSGPGYLAACPRGWAAGRRPAATPATSNCASRSRTGGGDARLQFPTTGALWLWRARLEYVPGRLFAVELDPGEPPGLLERPEPEARERRPPNGTTQIPR
eukprot:scaffold10868_cov121-Isochrysis_galbana.AAC.7